MWVKLGDEFCDDAADLSDAAVRTHIDALAWSNRRLLDLVVPKRDLRRFAFSDDAERAAQELVDVGWWEDRGDSWRIAHRPEWQQTREQVEARRASNLRAQKHRRGDHSLCKPDNCKTLSAADNPDDTSGESPDDSADESPDDPGRDGSVSGQAPYEQPTTDVKSTTHDDARIGVCAHCGHRERLDDDDLCQVLECIASRVALARSAS